MPAVAPKPIIRVESPVKRLLTPKWTRLKHHDKQHALWVSKARFRVVPAGRRSGKTEIAKRFIVKKALEFNSHPDGWFVLAAPTHAQAKRIYWEDLKKFVPEWAIDRVFEADMTIRLVTGTEITVMGMDMPARVEGRPLDGIVLDEYADMKSVVWTKHVRPALSTLGRPGWAWFIGVPEGRNHYYQLYISACGDDSGQWEAFTWKSAEILDPEEIAAARKDLDAKTFEQEYEAAFVNFEGRVYYDFDRAVHACTRLRYNPNLPLIFSLDFNHKPGTALIIQEQMYTGKLKDVVKKEPITCVIGEVWIPNNSNTPMVCRKLVQDYGQHRGPVYVYGDPSGGQKRSSAVRGSDWDLVREVLEPEFDDLNFRYRRATPPVRSRINAMNSRIRSADGMVRFLVDPVAARHTVDDYEGVSYIEGGAGDIDKSDELFTHLTDEGGYYCEKRYPIAGGLVTRSTEVGASA